jgi:hypothetical protein
MLRPLALLLVGPFLAGAAVFVWAAVQPSWSVYTINGDCGTQHPATFRDYLRWRRDAAAHGQTPRAFTEGDNLTATALLFAQAVEATVSVAAAGFLVEYLIRSRSRRHTPTPRSA